MPRESPDTYFKQFDGYLLVEPRPGGPDPAAVYRDLAVYCIEKQIRRVLVKPPDDDLVGERGLRNAMNMMVLAGLPPEFRIALVAQTERVAARYRITERELRDAGLDARLFDAEESAVRWLSAERAV